MAQTRRCSAGLLISTEASQVPLGIEAGRWLISPFCRLSLSCRFCPLWAVRPRQ